MSEASGLKNTGEISVEKIFHIAFGVDSDYIRSMGVTIASLVRHNPQIEFHFHVFSPSISRQDEQKLRAIEKKHNVAVYFKKVDPSVFLEYSRFPSFSQYSAAIFTRLLIPHALQHVTSKVLYLDADILCLGDISEIVDMDISNDIVAVVHDNGAETVERQCEKLLLKTNQYFNSGVLYINIPSWIRSRVTEKTIEVLGKSEQKFIFPDQDALNIVLDGKARMMESKWNFQYNLNSLLNNGDYLMVEMESIILIHFTGRVKPWHKWSLHESRKLFGEYQSASPWAGVPLDMPKNYKEMRLFSQFLYGRGRKVEAGYWFAKYLIKKLSEK